MPAYSTIEKDGKAHTYWRVVRSVRRGAKVFQETVALLDAERRAKAQRMASASTGRDGQGRDFLEAQQPVRLKLDGVRLERGLAFGDGLLGWTLWRALKLDEACAPSARRARVCGAATAATTGPTASRSASGSW